MTIDPLLDFKRLRVELADQIAIVTLVSPPVNAQDRGMREELVRAFDILGLSDDVRAIILTGEGKAFCAGADLAERAAIESEPGGYAQHNRLVRASLDCVSECPKPVIAAVNGAAVGSGCALALCCDILLVAEEAFMAMTEVDYGLAGGVRYLLRAFSPSDARLMYFTARRIAGAELLRMNVASACVPREQLLETAIEIARTIAAKAPLAVETAKRSFALTEEMPMRDGYRYEQIQTATLAGTEDTKEALSAFRERRKPIFHRR